MMKVLKTVFFYKEVQLMEGAGELVAIVEAFFNALKVIINAIKSLFGMGEAEEAPAESEVSQG